MSAKTLRKLAVVAACVAGLLLPAGSARADAATEAQLQYELGTELHKQARYTEALERFIASHRLVPNANVAFNVASLFQYLERRKEAYNWFGICAQLATDLERRAQAEQHMKALAEQLSILEITTHPPGAQLFIDRLDLGSVGNSPLRVAVDSGKRRIIARHPDHAEQAIEETLDIGVVRSVHLVLPPLLGALVVESSPPGALVRLDPEGTVLGTAPLSLRLPVGEHRLTLSLPSYAEQTRSVRVAEGQESRLAVGLTRAAGTVSVLTAKGNVPGALLILDGAPLTRAPASLSDLTPGTHTLEIQADGHEPWSTQLLLEPGAATRIDYHLVNPDDRPWPGFRFLGYGTGAALLVGGGIVGLTALSARSDFERSPSRERLDTVNARNTITDVLLGAGVLVLAGTALWDLLSGPTPQSKGTVSVSR